MTVEIDTETLRKVARLNTDAADELSRTPGEPPDMADLGIGGPIIAEWVAMGGQRCLGGARLLDTVAAVIEAILADTRATEDEVKRAFQFRAQKVNPDEEGPR